MGFSPQNLNFPSQQGFHPSRIYCQKSIFVFLTSLTNFSDHFLSASACYYFFSDLFGYLFLWRPENRLQQMPPLYNAYGVGALRNKFYKDNPNWTPKTDLVEAWSIWNSFFTAILFGLKHWDPIWRFPFFKMLSMSLFLLAGFDNYFLFLLF